MSIFDLHCDTIGVIHQKKKENIDINLITNNLQVDINKLVSGNYFAQCFAMFIYYKVENPYQECIDMINTFYNEINGVKELNLIRNYNDFTTNNINAILTIEEGGVIRNIDDLYKFYDLGVRMICLTWNFENKIGFPNINLSKDKVDIFTPDLLNGLKPFGFELINEMNKLGIIIDVSHLSDKGFWDVINTSTKPIVASHSNCRSLCKCVRNLTDDMIIALDKNGGVMGMNYCNEFLSDDYEKGKNTIDCVIEHIKYIKQLVGVDIISLGSDFDGIDPNIKLKDSSMLNELINRLECEGFTKEEIDKITYKNALRVFKANLK